MLTIVTPSLNSADVIEHCLRSVAEQALTPGIEVEHILVDGESGDGTVALARAINPRLRVISAPPDGIYAALNRGIAEAAGAVVGVLHADDFYADAGVLARVVAAFADPAVGACYGDLCYVDRSDTTRVVRYWRAGEFRPQRFANGWMPPHPTFFLRRELYRAHGLYRSDLGTAADYELMLRMLLKHGVRAAYLPRVLVHMRSGGASNASLWARLAANRMDRRAWRVNGLRPRPWTTLAKPLRKLGQWWHRGDAQQGTY